MNAFLVFVYNRVNQVFKQLEKSFDKPFLPIGNTFPEEDSTINDINMDWAILLNRNHAMMLAFEYDCLFLLENILLSESKNK